MKVQPVKIGVIGIGVVGRGRSKTIARDTKNAELTAVCDIDPQALKWAEEEFGDEVGRYASSTEMLPHVDAVVIATPHDSHPTLALEAFEAGKHVLIEKPAGITPGSVREMNAAAEKAGTAFAIHFQHRYKGPNQLVHDLVHNGEIGKVRRINWIITTWFRSQRYFNTGGWRGTWEGEGGGVLMNQAPHQLDLWQWFFGMPERVRAFCYNGKYHDIETEDEATLFMEYADGTTGVFITSTAENPGTNRLEIVAERGKVVVEDGKVTYRRLKDNVQEVIETSEHMGWGGPVWNVDVDIPDKVGMPIHDWVAAIVGGDYSKLIAPGASGINECLLAAAAIKSSWDDEWVGLADFDDEAYAKQLREKIDQSDFVKPELATPNYDENY